LPTFSGWTVMGENNENKGGIDAGVSEKSSQGEEKTAGFKAILITAGFTFLGTLIGVFGKGCSDLQVEKQKAAEVQDVERQKAAASQQLERQKFDSALVNTAIAGSDPDARLQFLEFMVKTHLILDKDIRDGVESYIKEVQANSGGAKKKTVPQFVPTTETQQQLRSATRVFVSGDPQLQFLKRNFAKLSSTGITADPPRILNDNTRPKETNEIRYFHLEDQQEAQHIALAVRDIFGVDLPDPKLYDDPQAPPRYIEIWITRIP
jgi:hypothetical protein